MHHLAKITKREWNRFKRGQPHGVSVTVGDEEVYGDEREEGVLSGNILVSGDGTIKTGDSGARVVMDRDGVRLYDGSGVIVVNLDTLTGSGSFKGTIEGSEFWAPQKATGAHRLVINRGGLDRKLEWLDTVDVQRALIDGSDGLLQLVAYNSTRSKNASLHLSAPEVGEPFASLKMANGSQDAQMDLSTVDWNVYLRDSANVLSISSSGVIFRGYDGSPVFQFIDDGVARIALSLNGLTVYPGGAPPTHGVLVKVDGTFTGQVINAQAARVANDVYVFFRGVSDYDGTPDGEFNLYGDGDGQCDGAWSGGGADYAELFETTDGQPIPPGTAVTFEGRKVRPARAGDTDVKIVSSNPSFVGNDPLNWPGKNVRDEFGARVLDENGDRKLAPGFDRDQEYVPRSRRPEWVPVALLGQVAALDDGTCKVNGYAAPSYGRLTAADKGWRVLERRAANVVVVLIV